MRPWTNHLCYIFHSTENHNSNWIDQQLSREALSGIITAKRSEFHRQGRPLGERLFAETPDELVARIGAYWEATHEYDPTP